MELRGIILLSVVGALIVFMVAVLIHNEMQDKPEGGRDSADSSQKK